MTQRTQPPSPPAILPSYGRQDGPIAWLAHEAWDHLWPWSHRGMQRSRLLVAAGTGLAVAASTAWVLGATGRIGGAAVLGWWLGWSAFEVLARMVSKPYVKEGPWWGRRYRSAGLMDMVCYVSFKNLMIGAGVFLCLRFAGVLPA